MKKFANGLQIALLVARHAITDAVVNTVTSTNKAVWLAALFGVVWTLDIEALRIDPGYAFVALAMACGADYAARAWWKYVAPLPIQKAPRYETPGEALVHMIEMGVDPVEVERIFGVKLIDYALFYPGLQAVGTDETAGQAGTEPVR